MAARDYSKRNHRIHSITCLHCRQPALVTANTVRFCSHSCARKSQAQPIEQRFWPKVDQSGDCWTWRGSVDSGGYGTIKGATNQNLKAHRVSWVLAKGDIPRGLDVLHRCDNRRCVRPEHLFLGTDTENMADMVQKGRSAKLPGERNPAAKLTPEQVNEIRQSKEFSTTLAARFGVHKETVGRIRRGLSWGHG